MWRRRVTLKDGIPHRVVVVECLLCLWFGQLVEYIRGDKNWDFG